MTRDHPAISADARQQGTLSWWWLGAGLIRILAPLGALILEGWPALIGTLLVQEGGLWLSGRLVGGCRRRLARGLFVGAWGLRMLIVLPTHYVAMLGNDNGALYRDDYTNDLVGEWLVRIARGDGGVSIFPGHQYLLDSIYTYVLMAIYAIFGYSPLLPKVLNIGLAALCVVLVFDIARKVFSPRAAMLAALGAAVLPSLVVWSIASLKETMVLAAALVALWLVQFLSTAGRRDRRIVDAGVALVAVLALLLDLRSTTAFIIVGLVGLIGVARAHVRLPRWQVGLTTLIVLGVLVGALALDRVRSSNRPLSSTFEDLALQIRHRRAQEAAGAASQLRPESDALTDNGRPAAEAASDFEPFSIVGDVLDPLGYALLAPAPWQAQSQAELAASAEMPVWYVLIFASFFAARAGPRQKLFVACLVIYAVANWLILAAVEGNLGNLLRHRLMLEPTLLILGGAGLEWLWARRANLQLFAGAGQPVLSHEDMLKRG